MSDAPAGPLVVDVRIGFTSFVLEVSFDEPLAGILGLIGPSGSGKSTLLRIIAGLEDAATGTVRYEDDCWQDSVKRSFVPACQRPVGYVFQHARLFPHLNVVGNLDYAWSRRSNDGGNIAKADVVEAMGISSLLDRDVGSLSGGERQRVAIARTVLARPRLLLLDEPLASLDVGARNDILPYVETLNAHFGIPAIYVSHTVSEMARLADRVILIDNGRIDAVGSAAGILGRESLRASSLPFEPVSILDVVVTGHIEELHLTRVMHGGQVLTIPELKTTGVGESARLAVRASDVVVASGDPGKLSVRNELEGTISAIAEIPDSAFALVSIDVSGTPLKARITRHAIAELGLAVGAPVYALIKTATFDRGV